MLDYGLCELTRLEYNIHLQMVQLRNVVYCEDTQLVWWLFYYILCFVFKEVEEVLCSMVVSFFVACIKNMLLVVLSLDTPYAIFNKHIHSLVYN